MGRFRVSSPGLHPESRPGAVYARAYGQCAVVAQAFSGAILGGARPVDGEDRVMAARTADGWRRAGAVGAVWVGAVRDLDFGRLV